MEIWALAAAVEVVVVAALTMRWGSDVSRLGGAAFVAVRSSPSVVRALGPVAVLEASAVATFVYALTHTRLVPSSTCTSRAGLLNCFRRVHDTRLLVVAGCLAVAGAIAYVIGQHGRSTASSAQRHANAAR